MQLSAMHQGDAWQLPASSLTLVCDGQPWACWKEQGWDWLAAALANTSQLSAEPRQQNSISLRLGLQVHVVYIHHRTVMEITL